jgi:hypothetical protein
MGNSTVVATDEPGIVVIEGFIVARMRDGRPETVGSVVVDPLEAERKRTIATDVIGGPTWTVQRAVLVLPELAP